MTITDEQRDYVLAIPVRERFALAWISFTDAVYLMLPRTAAALPGPPPLGPSFAVLFTVCIVLARVLP